MSYFRLEAGTPVYLQRFFSLLSCAKPDYVFYILLFALLTTAQFLHSAFEVQLDNYSTTAIVQIFALVLVLYAYWKGFLPKVRLRWWHWLVLAWIVWGWLAVVSSSWHAPAISRQVQWMLVLMVILTTYGAIQSGRASMTGIMLVMLLGLVVHLGNMLITWFTIVGPRKIDWTVLFYPFTNIRHFGYLMVIYVVLSLYYSLYGHDSILRRLAFVGFVLSAALMFWSGGRGGSIAVIATLSLCLLLMSANLRHKALAITVIGGTAGYLAQLPFWVKNPALGTGSAIARSLDAQGTGFTSGRLEIWEKGLNYVVNHPWFGLGPDGYRFWPEKLSTTIQPHNAFLQSALEWGVIGFFLFWLIIAFYWFGAVKQIKSERPNAPFAAFMVVTVLLAHGLSDGTLYHIVPLMHFAVAFGVMITGIETAPNTRTRSAVDNHTRNNGPVMSITIMLLIGVIGLNGYIVRRQDQLPIPHPDSWEMTLIRSFPASIRPGMDRWLQEWNTSHPAAHTEWREWLIHNSERAYVYSLQKALELRARGEHEAARAIIQDLLVKTSPRQAARRKYLESLLAGQEHKM